MHSSCLNQNNLKNKANEYEPTKSWDSHEFTIQDQEKRKGKKTKLKAANLSYLICYELFVPAAIFDVILPIEPGLKQEITAPVGKHRIAQGHLSMWTEGGGDRKAYYMISRWPCWPLEQHLPPTAPFVNVNGFSVTLC